MRYLQAFVVGLLTFIITILFIDLPLSIFALGGFALGDSANIYSLIIPLLLAVLTGLDWFIKTAPEDKLKTNNMQVFRIGAWIAIIGIVLTTCVGLSLGWVVTPHYSYEAWFGWGDLVGLIITMLIRVVPVVVLQLIIYPIFYILNSRDKEISGVKMWLFYAFELVIGIAPLTMFGHYEWW